MELHLDRKLAERRIFPSIELRRSGTRKEELLLAKDELDKIWAIRKAMSNSDEFMEQFIKKLVDTKNNREFLDSIEIKTKKVKVPSQTSTPAPSTTSTPSSTTVS